MPRVTRRKMYYDVAGRLLRTDYVPLNATSAGPEDTVLKYDYLNSPGDLANANGKLVRVQDRSGTTVFAYDVAGRVRTATSTIDGVQYASTTTYDRAGKRTSVTLSGRLGGPLSLRDGRRALERHHA